MDFMSLRSGDIENPQPKSKEYSSETVPGLQHLKYLHVLSGSLKKAAVNSAWVRPKSLLFMYLFWASQDI